MKIRPSVVVLICLVALVAAWLWWPRGSVPSATVAKNNPAALAITTSPASPAVQAANSVAAEDTGKNSAAATNRLTYRLSNSPKANTPEGYTAFTHAPHAVILENALVDTDAKIDFSIPKQLKSSGDPGAYIVQARGVVDVSFRSLLVSAGAQEISYIPNNALLVRLTAGAANALTGNPLVQAVLPYEPYYKVQASLLGAAVAEKPLLIGQVLTLGLFADNAEATVAQIENMGGVVLARDRSPFGPVVRINPPQDWIALAQLPGVQRIEPTHQRKAANDLARATMGVAVNAVTTNTYLNLSGSNVVVEVNDSGIDATHPDLIGRVFGEFASSIVDTDGHGTHVAGIIGGSGAESLTVTNARGSINPGTNTQYRGKAPLAKLVSLGFLGANDTNFFIGDSDLQEAPANTNALISCNAWVNDGVNEYDLSAASYDAAVRDALPEITGPQPVLFVFAAGNDGAGDASGQSGNADSISSPGTAKDVVTVGALEQFRNITNIVTALDGTSNAIWSAETDSSSQVADYSARGNVGIFTEGTYGRFKPDVIAPGSFVVSTRSTMWDTNAYYNVTNFHTAFYGGLVARTNALQYGILTIPMNTIGVKITITANAQSPVPFPKFPIYVSAGGVPTPTLFDIQKNNNSVSIPPDAGGAIAGLGSIANGQIEFAIGDGTNIPASFDLTTQVITTNDLGNQLAVEQFLNDNLCTAPQFYRYESGTSLSAAAVSGTLALMQDFFTNTLHLTPSPALLKAMLINGARVAGSYKYAVTNSINLQGWGLVKLSNSIPLALTNTVVTANKPLFFLDQSPTNTVKTGDRRTYLVSVPTPAARAQTLRVTLAWTDPPGNPAAGIKLVNNLDLVITNLGNGAVYYGNNFSSSANPPNSLPAATNGTAFTDNINNVENIYLTPTLGTNYSITVVGTAVNVNAVTLEQTNVVQDFALVVSSGEGNNTNGFTFAPGAPSFTVNPAPVINYLLATNGILFNQYAGANAPWLSTNTLAVTNGVYGFAPSAVVGLGVTNQWQFFVVTNTFALTNAAFKYAAFITFLPATLALPREGGYVTTAQNPTRPEADLELFVATSPDALAAQITNINPTVIANCLNASSGDGASIGRGGVEFVTYSNSVANQVYYVGVQCQDQMAGQYAFVSIFTDTPFGVLNPDGSQDVFGKLAPAVIPDGNNAHPGVSYSLGLALYPMQTRRVTLTNTVWHQNFGDLSGGLTHDQEFSMLNNHDGLGFVNSRVFVYDDSGEGPTNGLIHTDPPGTLKNFEAQEGSGLWVLNEIDDNYTQTGHVDNFTLRIYPHEDLTGGTTNTIAGQSWFYDYIDVPAGYTNLLVLATNLPTTSTPFIQLYLNGDNTQPDFATFLLRTLLTNGTPPGNSLSYGPPLAPGRYWIGIYNPDTIPHDVTLSAILSYNAAAALTVDYFSRGPVPLLDDAVIADFIRVTNTQTIQGFSVGLRVDHPRISDLVFHLVSPAGVRYLLMENRGGQDTNGCGVSVITTNFVNVGSSGGPSATTNQIDTHLTSGTIPVNYNMFGIPDEMTIYYGPTNANSTANLITNIFVSGSGLLTISFPPPTATISSTFLTIVMNATNHPARTFWTYNVGGVVTNNYYLTFTEDTNQTTTPIKFGPPPFIPLATTTNIWSDSFESYPDGTNFAPAFLGGWNVSAGQAVVATNPPAFDGTNFLTLPAGGSISTNLPTLAGRKYQLQYAQGALPYERFYMADAFDGKVERLDTNFNSTTFPTIEATPYAVAVDGSGNLYVADGANSLIARYTPNGQRTVFADSSKGLITPKALAFDNAGNLYVADAATGAADGFVLRITPGGVPTVMASGLTTPVGVAVDSANNVYVSEFLLGDIQKITAPGVFAPFFTVPTSGDNLQGLALDPSGNLYVADNTDGSIWSITPAGVAAIFFPAGPLNAPMALVFDNNTNLYVTDGTLTLWQLNPPIATSVAITGNGASGLAFYNSNPDSQNDLGWQTQSTTFTAASSGTPLVLDAGFNSAVTVGGQVVSTAYFNATFDAFTLTQLPSDLFYQPEQSLADLLNTSPLGDWQLEVLDNRAGATNNARLVDWRLEFVLANTNLAPAVLGTFNSVNSGPGSQITSKLVAGGGYFGYYTVQVPGGATVATNRLLTASLPVNVWFTTNNPATNSSASGTLLLTAVNGGTTNLDTTTIPTIYYLLIENTNSTAVTFTVEVDFDNNAATPPLKFSAAKVSKSGKVQMQWQPIRGARYKVQWSDTLPPVWHTITTPTVSTTNSVSTFIDNGTQTAPLGPQRYYRLWRVP